MAALTDSTNSVSYDPEHRPGVSNLLELVSHFSSGDTSAQTLATQYANLNLGQFKKVVSETISERLSPMRAKFEQLLAEDGGKYLDHVEKQGAVKARESADATMALVKESIWL